MTEGVVVALEAVEVDHAAERVDRQADRDARPRRPLRLIRTACAPQKAAAMPMAANIGRSEIAAPSQPSADRAPITPIESALIAASSCCATRA